MRLYNNIIACVNRQSTVTGMRVLTNRKWYAIQKARARTNETQLLRDLLKKRYKLSAYITNVSHAAVLAGYPFWTA